MSIGPVPPVGGSWVANAVTNPVGGSTATNASTDASTDASTAAAASGATDSTGSGFGDLVTKGLDALQSTQTKADNLAVQAATGDLTDVHDYMIASTEASLATELTVAVRNKAVESFNEIMRMPV